MRRDSKVDENQGAIVNKLRKKGYTVQSLASVGRGCPDLLVGKDGVNILLELKMPREKLNPGQRAWHDSWLGTVYTVFSDEEALAICEACVILDEDRLQRTKDAVVRHMFGVL